MTHLSIVRPLCPHFFLATVAMIINLPASAAWSSTCHQCQHRLAFVEYISISPGSSSFVSSFSFYGMDCLALLGPRDGDDVLLLMEPGYNNLTNSPQGRLRSSLNSIWLQLGLAYVECTARPKMQCSLFVLGHGNRICEPVVCESLAAVSSRIQPTASQLCSQSSCTPSMATAASAAISRLSANRSPRMTWRLGCSPATTTIQQKDCWRLPAKTADLSAIVPG